MSETIRPNYYAIIPASIRYDADITPNAKLLYAEITALSNQSGFCWANNQYFANLYGVSIRSIQNWLSELKKSGYIELANECDDEKRMISIGVKKTSPPMKLSSPPHEENFIPPHENIFTHNITSINTKKNNKGETPRSPRQIDYQQIVEAYSSICKSYPKVTKLSEARKKAIRARFASGYTLDDFQRLFEKAEASSFLKGANDRNWQANFDWLIKDANMAKALDGNYDVITSQKPNGSPKQSYDGEANVDFLGR